MPSFADVFFESVCYILNMFSGVIFFGDTELSTEFEYQGTLFILSAETVLKSFIDYVKNDSIDILGHDVLLIIDGIYGSVIEGPTYLLNTLPLVFIKVNLVVSDSFYPILMYLGNDIVITVRVDYDAIEYVYEYMFSGSPYYYQALLYSLLVYVFRLYNHSRTEIFFTSNYVDVDANNLEGIKQEKRNMYRDSTPQGLFLTVRGLISRNSSITLLYDFTVSQLLKLFFFVKKGMFFMTALYMKTFIQEYKNKSIYQIGRALFKRTSYFGNFSSLRTKGYKNRKNK